MTSLSFSVVTYHNEPAEIERLLQSVSKCGRDHSLTLIDNGGQAEMETLVARYGYNYLCPGQNIGFAAAHNLALRKNIDRARYHVIINPDVYFPAGTFNDIVAYLDQHPQTGACVPKVLYPDGRLQRLCKMVPTPFDLFARRFLPGFAQSWFREKMQRYEFLNYDYNHNLLVPVLSGCCLSIRNEVLQQVGFFDERFFLYLEDVDYSRRIHRHFQTLHLADSYIYHDYRKASYKNLRGLKLHLRSAVQYFNKWGWFNDRERRQINRRVREQNQAHKIS